MKLMRLPWENLLLSVTLLFTIQEPRALINLAIVFLNAKNWISSGKAHNPENAPHRREILDHLMKHNQRLLLVYEPSAENVADYATRHFGEQSFLQNSSIRPTDFFIWLRRKQQVCG